MEIAFVAILVVIVFVIGYFFGICVGSDKIYEINGILFAIMIFAIIVVLTGIIFGIGAICGIL